MRNKWISRMLCMIAVLAFLPAAARTEDARPTVQANAAGSASAQTAEASDREMYAQPKNDADRQNAKPGKAASARHQNRRGTNRFSELLREDGARSSRHVHVYDGGDACIFCGAERHDYEQDGIPEAFYRATCPEEGTLLTVRPKREDGKAIDLPVQVYLPYGYTNTKKYNVLFLAPGSEGRITDWMDTPKTMHIPGKKESRTISGKQLFDWLIYDGQAAPFIAVSMDMQPYEGSYVNAYRRYVDRIVQYWLPMIIDGEGVCRDGDGNNCSVQFGGTYAVSSTETDIEAAKAHFAIAGLSQGATFVSLYAVDPTAALGRRFGNKIIMSSFMGADKLEPSYNAAPDNTDRLYFVSGGKKDQSGGSEPINSYAIMQSCKTNKTLSRFPFYTMDSGHGWYTWLRGIAAAMQDAMKTGN